MSQAVSTVNPPVAIPLVCRHPTGRPPDVAKAAIADFDLENSDVCFEFNGACTSMRSMWKPTGPLVIAGRTLTDKEAWRHEFEDELREQCDGLVEKDWLIEVSGALFRRSPDEDPRRMAQLAYAILVFDPEEIEEAEHAASARAMRRSGLH